MLERKPKLQNAMFAPMVSVRRGPMVLMAGSAGFIAK
ncbi:hypothetical protein C100_12420 [Sphingobium sp. C100]|nr:hypothetical protein C100_12420 [Sphingobium sp. C100]